MFNFMNHQKFGRTMLNVSKNIVNEIFNIIKTRINLFILELKEEKINFIQLLLISGLTVFFTAFGIISLIITIIWSINPQYRFIAIIINTVILFLLAILFGIWSVTKSRQLTLLCHTYKELEIDSELFRK
ncbi:MAG: hypothetical protein FT671_00165 [Pantoea sp. Brub]|nr:hypothetical protein [Pantoea sp. Brub]